MPKNLVQERELDATPQEVFEAWSDPESLSVFMCPSEGMNPATVDVDFRVGGVYRIVMHGEQDYVQHGEYLEIDAPKRLRFTWISDFMPIDEQRTMVSLSFEAIGEGRTRLRLVHEEIPDTNSYDGHTGGWARIVEQLANHLARRRGR